MPSILRLGVVRPSKAGSTAQPGLQLPRHVVNGARQSPMQWHHLLHFDGMGVC